MSTKGFFGPNALTLGNPFPTPSGGGGSGKTWTTLITGFETSTDIFVHLTFVNGTFVIATNDSNQARKTVIVSTDGTNWTQHLVTTTPSGFRTEGVTFGAGVYLEVMDTGISTPRVYTSANLTAWALHSPGFAFGTIINPPTFGNGVFLLTAQGGSDYATSPDGITWTHHAVYVPHSWQIAPIFDGTQFVAPVIGTAGSAKLATSADGITWTESAVTLSVSGPNHLANDGTTQYVVGEGGSDSGDSLNSALTVDTPFSFNDPGNGTQAVSFGGGSWARSNSNDSGLRSSSDGLTWDTDTVPSAALFFSDIAFGLGEFIAIGGDQSSHNYAATRGP